MLICAAWGKTSTICTDLAKKLSLSDYKTLQTFGRRKVELGDEVGVSGRVDRLLGAAGAVAGRRAGHVRLQLEGPLPLIVFEEFLELVDVTNRPGIEALAAIKLRP